MRFIKILVLVRIVNAMKVPFFSVTSNGMRLLWPVDAVDIFSRQEVAHILHRVRCGVYVIMTPFTMMAEAMGVLHAQVQPLVTR